MTAYQLFCLILVFALSAKHTGFKEENEWRLIYMPDRDHRDLLKHKFHYAVGPRGVEPKLILKVAPMEGAIPDFRFSEIVERVLLGPSISTPLATASVARMLEKLNKPELVPKVHSSTTPAPFMARVAIAPHLGRWATLLSLEIGRSAEGNMSALHDDGLIQQ